MFECRRLLKTNGKKLLYDFATINKVFHTLDIRLKTLRHTLIN